MMLGVLVKFLNSNSLLSEILMIFEEEDANTVNSEIESKKNIFAVSK